MISKLKFFVTLLVSMITGLVFSQVTVDNNNPISGRFLGFNSTSGIDLPLENNGVRTLFSFENWPGYNNIGPQNNSSRIHFPTDPLEVQADIFSIVQIGDIINPAFQRDWMQVGTTYGAGGDLMYTGIIQDPANAGNQTGGDAVIAWGDNQSGGSGQGPDNFRFLFISNLTSATTGPNSDQGRETMRITPQGNIGMGNSFSNALQPSRRLVVHRQTNDPQFRIAHGLDADPLFGQNADFQVTQNGVLHLKASDDSTRRPVVVGFLRNEDDNPTPFTYLDVGGITRIRDLREDSTKTCLILGTFADTIANGDSADHYLTRLDFPQDSTLFLAGDATWRPVSGKDCRWKESIDGLTNDTVLYIGEDETSDCYRAKLGVGISALKSKMGVFNQTVRDKVSHALIVTTENDDSGWNGATSSGGIVGIISTAQSSSSIESGVNHIGIESSGLGGKIAVGLVAIADDGANHSIGVYSKATNATSAPGTPPDIPNIALYGEVSNSTDASVYLVGGTPVQTNQSIVLSDELIKTDIEDMENASEMLSQLSAKTYTHQSPVNRPIAFEEDLQYGFIAQEVQEILPSIVKQTTVPEIRDSLGNFIEGTSVELLGIQYDKLIPILVAGFQEQNALISDQAVMLTAQDEENQELLTQLDELKSEMAEMKNQMTEVMATLQSTQSKMNNCCGTAPTEKDRTETGAINLGQNFPNPFEDVTTINFSLDKPAQIRLEISDTQGRVLEVLVNQSLDQGEYTERWDASAYAPGTYYYSLYADTELRTKKMIKR